MYRENYKFEKIYKDKENFEKGISILKAMEYIVH